jgi:hypothetical protein
MRTTRTPSRAGARPSSSPMLVATSTTWRSRERACASFQAVRATQAILRTVVTVVAGTAVATRSRRAVDVLTHLRPPLVVYVVRRPRVT